MTTTDETASIKNDLNYIQMRLNDCYSRLEKQSAPKKKTIREIDPGWQKGYDDNCVCLTFMDELTSVVEFDMDSILSLYTLAPEIKITLNSHKIHSKTLMDLLKMLTRKKHYIINEYDFDSRSITLFKNQCL